MSPFYCHSCECHHTEVTRTASGDVFATSFQAAKFVKHTTLNAASPLHGIFTSVDTVGYQRLFQETLETGYFEVDTRSRVALVKVTNPSPGDVYRYGRFHAPAEAVKVAHPDRPGERHLYPADWPVQSRFCLACSGRLA